MVLLFIVRALSSLLWAGDILKLYAVMGVLLLLFQNAPNRIKLSGVVLFVTVGYLLPILIKFLDIKAIYIPNLLNSFVLLMVMLSTLGHMLLGQVLYYIGIFTNKSLLPKLKKYWLLFLTLTLLIWALALFIQNNELLHSFNQNSGP